MDDSDPENEREGYYNADPETGKIKEQYSDEDFIAALNQLATGDYLPSTGDVADELDCNTETARLRLKDLAEDGDVRQLNSKSGFHWLPADS